VAASQHRRCRRGNNKNLLERPCASVARWRKIETEDAPGTTKPMPPHATMEPLQSFDALGREWQTLEAVGEPSYFQSWTWVGCRAEERFPDPFLLRVEDGGRLIGLALLNRRRGRLYLSESGEVEQDRIFVEHNAPLAAAGREYDVAAMLSQAAWRLPGTRRLVVSGVAPAMLRAIGDTVIRQQCREAPYVDLQAIRTAGQTCIASLSANTRQQIRRSMRHYAAGGDLAIDRAETEEQARAWFGELVGLHGRSWRRRGQPGAFTPTLMRFHQDLLGRAMARGELDLMRITGGTGVVGYLYNFRFRGRISAYQSGFDDADPGPAGKPGLTCHLMAMERALAAGDRVYDLLAGDHRYKRSLARGSTTMVWAEVAPAGSMAGLAARLTQHARRLLSRI